MGIKSLVWGLVVIFIFTPSVASAASGVGVGTGKIMLDETLVGGTAYSLPAITVYNTGDEASDYEMEVTFNERQPQLKPQASWVSFNPKRFTLAPTESETVDMTITVPTSAKTGDYYAYLEAHSVTSKTSGQDTAHISAAAAAKFYFSAKNNPVIAQPGPPHNKPPQDNHHRPVHHGQIAHHKGVLSNCLSRFVSYVDPLVKSQGINGYVGR